MTNQALAGITVAVTRPENQAEPLCRLIEQHGGKALRFAGLEILGPAEPEQLQTLLNRIERFDIAIFISSNAVSGAAQRLPSSLPEALLLVAVGKATARAIKQTWHRTPVCPDQGANSETLLATPELTDVEGKHIIIFRGRGGREMLAETLQQRGAEVRYAEVYQRARPARDLAELQAGNPELITATSNESLQNLYDMADADQRQWLLTRQLIVIAERTAELARRLGFTHPAIIAPSTSDQGFIDAMLAWRQQGN